MSGNLTVDKCLEAQRTLRFFIGAQGNTASSDVRSIFSKLTDLEDGDSGPAPASVQPSSSLPQRKGARLTEKEEDATLLSTLEQTAEDVDDDLLAQPVAIVGPTENSKLRSYQREAVGFFADLYRHGIGGGILADEMGLGKTLQTISILAYIRQLKLTRGVHLVIVPLSVMGTWFNEFSVWCPSLKVRQFHGESRGPVGEEIVAASKSARPTDILEVVLTTYETVSREKAILKKLPFDVLVVDEAHRLKNEASQLATVLRLLQSNFRLLLTGTPLQNNLHELWALLNFLFPDIFRESSVFDAIFNIDSGHVQMDDLQKLHHVLRPFMLRRLKADVEKELPPKKETKLYIGLSVMQKKYYKSILEKNLADFAVAGQGTQSKRCKTALLNIIMQLRKACNHPYLFDGAEPGPPFTNGPHLWQNSGKMVLLHKLLKKLKDGGHRVLIFSQMTRMLDIIQDYCWTEGYPLCRIDGGMAVRDRERMLKDFTRPESDKFIFLLSTRAGGLGLNLACADVVVLFDSDWNPHADAQAIDRAHRIGQTKQVQVFRFIAENTVDEQIQERAERKLYLDAMVIQRGQLSEKHKQLSNEDLLEMVRFGADRAFKSSDALTDEDIDAIIGRGELKTEETAQQLGTAKHNLKSFSMSAPQRSAAHMHSRPNGAGDEVEDGTAVEDVDSGTPMDQEDRDALLAAALSAPSPPRLRRGLAGRGVLEPGARSSPASAFSKAEVNAADTLETPSAAEALATQVVPLAERIFNAVSKNTELLSIVTWFGPSPSVESAVLIFQQESIKNPGILRTSWLDQYNPGGVDEEGDEEEEDEDEALEGTLQQKQQPQQPSLGEPGSQADEEVLTISDSPVPPPPQEVTIDMSMEIPEDELFAANQQATQDGTPMQVDGTPNQQAPKRKRKKYKRRPKWWFPLPDNKALPNKTWKRLRQAMHELGFSTSRVRRMGAIEPQSFYNWSLISSAIRACGAGNDAFVAAADGEAEDNENAVVLPPSSTDPLHVQQQLAALQQEPAGHHCYIWGAVDWTVQGSTARDRSHLKLSRPTYLPLHKPMTIVDVAVGPRTIVLINSLGEAFMMGNGARGALNQVMEYSYGPVRVELRTGRNPRYIKAATGAGHTLLLTEHGEVVSFGLGADGQLGRLMRQSHEEVEAAKQGNRKSIDFAVRPSFVKEGLKDKVVRQIACAPNSSFALTETGELYSWGSSADGILGISATDTGAGFASTTPFTSVERPQLVESMLGRKVVQLSAGARHLVLLDDNGKVYTCGFGGYHRLGLRDARDRALPTLVSALEHVRIKQITAGTEHTMVMSEEGHVFWWGRYGTRTSGQQTPEHVQSLGEVELDQLAAGRGINFALNKTGHVWVWGQPPVKETLGMDCDGRDLNPARQLADFSSQKVVRIAACESQVVVLVDGKTSNSEVCSACGDGGALLLCDTCPLAFHASCLSKPLNATTNTEDGEWSCPRCRAFRADIPKWLEEHDGLFKPMVELLEFRQPLSFAPPTGLFSISDEFLLYQDATEFHALCDGGLRARRDALVKLRNGVGLTELPPQASEVSSSHRVAQMQEMSRQFRRQQAEAFRKERIQQLKEFQARQTHMVQEFHAQERKAFQLDAQLAAETLTLRHYAAVLAVDQLPEQYFGARINFAPSSVLLGSASNARAPTVEDQMALDRQAKVRREEMVAVQDRDLQALQARQATAMHLIMSREVEWFEEQMQTQYQTQLMAQASAVQQLSSEQMTQLQQQLTPQQIQQLKARAAAAALPEPQVPVGGRLVGSPDRKRPHSDTEIEIEDSPSAKRVA